MQVDLRRGGHALVDDEDRSLVGEWVWFKVAKGFICRSSTLEERAGGASTVLHLHRLVVCAERGSVVLFRNGDRSDCRKANLEVVSAAEYASKWRPPSKPRPKFDDAEAIKRLVLHIPKWARDALREETERRKMTLSAIVLEALHARVFVRVHEAVTVAPAATKPIGTL